jgi:hypothetical protein
LASRVISLRLRSQALLVPPVLSCAP